MTVKNLRLAFHAFWIVFCAFWLFTSCGKNTLKVKPPRESQVESPELSPTPLPTDSPQASCPTPLSATLSLVYPSSLGAITSSTGVVWRIDVVGCNSRFRLSDGSDIFSASVNAVKHYGPGPRSESFRIFGLAESGDSIVGSVEVTSPGFTVPVPPTNPNPDPNPQPIPAARCSITKESLLGPDDDRVSFQIHALSPSTITARVNGTIAAFDTNLAIRPNAAGIYEVNGVVDGPGEPGICRAVFYPPHCELSIVNTNYAAANLKVKLFGPVDRATLDGTALTLPAPPASSVNVIKNFTAAGSKTSTGRVFGPDGDEDKSTVTYSRPAPQVAKVIYSYWSDADYWITVTPSSLTIHTGTWWPASDVQMIAFREDGSKTIEFQATEPFARTIDLNGTRSYSGNYAPFLWGNVSPALFRSAALGFAAQTVMHTGTAIGAGSNRNGVHNLQHTPGTYLHYSANDTAYGAAYYQVQLCRPGMAGVSCD